ncbi:MAG: L-alanine-DL-glutamate epimerase-like enolase superfamily enzyme [Parasphingorhabdus sp.]|jgi:L-alanine-DL-glutamate epimerase-like enolase superfamily enzyme
MKVKSIEAWLLLTPDDGRPHWVSHFIVPRASELLVRIGTEDGLYGIGLATSYTPIQAVEQAIDGGILNNLLGREFPGPEQIYEELFSLTWKRRSFENGWSREAILRISAAVDIALWDLMGKQAGMPLFQIFGGYRSEVPAYATCAYYRDGKDMKELRDEMEMLKRQGHRAYKAKIGGIDLLEDIERLRVVREVIGSDSELMVDVNRGWDLDTAIKGAKLLEQFSPTWLEEPVHWADDHRELTLLSRHSKIPLSAGESESTPYACRSLVEQGAVKFLQFDCTMMGGFTQGRKLTALCELNHVRVAPHHDCFIHAHIVASSPAGYIVESFTDPERDPLQAELFINPPRIENGTLYLNKQPGLGLELSPAALEKFGRKILS